MEENYPSKRPVEKLNFASLFARKFNRPWNVYVSEPFAFSTGPMGRGLEFFHAPTISLDFETFRTSETRLFLGERSMEILKSTKSRVIPSEITRGVKNSMKIGRSRKFETQGIQFRTTGIFLRNARTRFLVHFSSLHESYSSKQLLDKGFNGTDAIFTRLMASLLLLLDRERKMLDAGIELNRI